MPLVGALRRLLPFVAALLVVPGGAAAQAPLYTVETVEVDATADSATAAREQGLDRARVKAFDRMVERLVLRSALERVPDLGPERIANLLRDFEVFDERTSNVRYLAEVTFRFRPEGVRQFLRDNGIAFAVTRSKPVVVLPVWGEGEDAVLWDNSNPWREAWADRAEQTGLVPLIVPLGDLGDIRAVGVQDALDGNRAALEAIAGRYGAEDVLVTQARLAGDPEAFTGSMQVVTSRIGTPAMERTLVDNVQQRRDEPLADMLARAADGVARDVEETWKRANLIDFDTRHRLQVEVPLDGLDRWVSVRARLAAVVRIERIALTALTREAARLELAYYGDRAQLALALQQNDLVLARTNPDGSATAVATPTEQGDSAGGLTSDGSLAPDRTGQPHDPNDWVLRAAEMAADAAAPAPQDGQAGGRGARGTTDGAQGPAAGRPAAGRPTSGRPAPGGPRGAPAEQPAAQ
jgi:hypothetical protein